MCSTTLKSTQEHHNTHHHSTHPFVCAKLLVTVALCTSLLDIYIWETSVVSCGNCLIVAHTKLRMVNKSCVHFSSWIIHLRNLIVVSCCWVYGLVVHVQVWNTLDQIMGSSSTFFFLTSPLTIHMRAVDIILVLWFDICCLAVHVQALSSHGLIGHHEGTDKNHVHFRFSINYTILW